MSNSAKGGAQVAAVIIGSLMASSLARAEGQNIKINASFDMIVDCNEPVQLSNVPVHSNFKGVLNSDKTGSADLTLTAGFGSNTIHFEGGLGTRPQPAPGGTAMLHVLPGNRLETTWGLPNENIMAILKVSGHSCEASLNFRLKSGSGQYSLFDGQRFYFCARPRLTGTSCTVE